MSIKLIQMFFVSFFDVDKEYNSYLISFLSFSELFPAFSCAKEIGNLLTIWFGVSILSHFPLCSFPCAADSSLSNSGMSVLCLSSDFFCLLIFVFSATLSSNSGFCSNFTVFYNLKT